MTAWNLKKVESTNSRLHGICLVGRLPKVTDAHEKRFPCTEWHTSARGSLPRQFSSKRMNKASPIITALLLTLPPAGGKGPDREPDCRCLRLSHACSFSAAVSSSPETLPAVLPQRGAVAGIRRLTESAGKGGYYDGKGDCLKVAVIVQDGQHSLDDSPHLPYLASRLVCSEIHTMATDPVCSGAGLQQLGRE